MMKHLLIFAARRRTLPIYRAVIFSPKIGEEDRVVFQSDKTDFMSAFLRSNRTRPVMPYKILSPTGQVPIWRDGSYRFCRLRCGRKGEGEAVNYRIVSHGDQTGLYEVDENLHLPSALPHGIMEMGQ